ncbi:MAG: NAD(P)/FAD-dependent oxidoreductase [Verrucomicrobiales bacterium]|nr:NAD(P)/FAD-dependent oxidoreductase [Verrucomicrobiales bacterium]
MSKPEILVVGGGAAGFFAAIAGAEADPDARVTILEKSPAFLTKVRISGGGRCNVTHSCFEPRELTTCYPRGERALIAPFHRFQARDTVQWFASRGVVLKTEGDGRMFPTTDSSETIVECLLAAARAARVILRSGVGVERIERTEQGRFGATLSTGELMECDRVLLATGGCRSAALGQLAVSLGHTLEPPVPSLFTFHIAVPWLRALSGVSLEDAEVSVSGAGLRERGPLLLTHWGLSGPAVLRLSAWGARSLHQCDYRFSLQVNWLPRLNPEQLLREFDQRRQGTPAKFVVNTTIAPLSARLWEQLVLSAGIAPDARWSAISKADLARLSLQLSRMELPVQGKSLNKDEFVTCGGVRLKEVDFKTMESRVCPGLYFAGEILDIDGITGGFNFQAAWTTGWIAGQAMALG